MAHANATAKELEEWHRQSQSLLNGEATVDQAAARMDEVQAEARKWGRPWMGVVRPSRPGC
jgi:raffinose/stachyose/melibiose transport system substrate-binding protein